MEENQNQQGNEDIEELESSEGSNESKGASVKQNNQILSDDILSDLETINEDFAPEIQAKKAKEEAEKKKKEGIEDEKEKEMELKPLEDNNKLQNIMDLNSDNINDFLKENGKEIKEEIKKEEENIDTTNSDGIKLEDLFKEFELNKELWAELNIKPELMNKVKTRVELEMKSFLKNKLIPLIQNLIN